MQGRIDTSFETLQRDLFASGMAARIGMSSFGVWLAIKSHADYNTGECWPGMRRLGEVTGLSLGAVSKAVQTLIDARLLRVVVASRGKRGNRYMARERLDVRVGERVLCTIVLDYVPARMRSTLRQVSEAVSSGRSGAEVFASCEIVPGEGFSWDGKAGVLRARIEGREVPSGPLDKTEAAPLVARVLALQRRGGG
jgi:hypothetical protein